MIIAGHKRVLSLSEKLQEEGEIKVSQNDAFALQTGNHSWDFDELEFDIRTMSHFFWIL